MSESDDVKQFTNISKNGLSLPDHLLEGRSDVKVTNLVTIDCSSGRCDQPPTADGNKSSDGPDGAFRSPGKVAPQDVDVKANHDRTMTSLSLPMATASGPVESSSSMATGLAEETTTTEKEREFDSSGDRFIIPWLCDLDEDEDQRLLDADDDDSDVEIDRCEANRYADHAPAPRKPTEMSRNSRTTTPGSRHEDRVLDDDSVFLSEIRQGPSTAKHRDKSGYGSTGSSTSGDDCLSVVRICNKTTPAFLRISPRGSDNDDDDDGSNGGQALLSRALAQVRRRLTDDLSPVLPDYETDAKGICIFVAIQIRVVHGLG